ncbi:hypothetical protein CLV94_0655 [Flavobacterium endophyticum]|uniref:KTSC domain-containing protein n=1 Tax=Flavobacterium endophyticum TaxID=1540163 RepID=A0A495MHZ9_9FLAO|nr:hypothetical protein [Flavobacterium endophyticum]RKS25617.1 hypothetical protein CLV94_0655 [Flavobacterium endophyticum]
MVPYKNKSKKSGIAAYELSNDSIKIRFADGETYLYTNESTGKDAVEQMKRLAVAGRGLSAYISQNVKDRFADKLD